MTRKKKEHDPDVLVKSQAFKVINHLIDSHYDDLLTWHQGIKSSMRRLLAGEARSLTTRVSYEEGGRNEIPMVFNQNELNKLIGAIEEAAKSDDAIHYLMRFKLRLLNDHDFSGGDISEQIAIFGKPE